MVVIMTGYRPMDTMIVNGDDGCDDNNDYYIREANRSLDFDGSDWRWNID